MLSNFKIIKKLKPSSDWIIQDNHENIRKISTEFEKDYILTQEENLLLNKMKYYIDACYNDKAEKYDIEAGVAIAAVQVNLLKRACYLHFDDEQNNEINYFMINPKIIERSFEKSYLKNGEGCLSVKQEHEGIVPRSYKIKVSFYDLLTNKEYEKEFKGYNAICIQHELDHLDGILYYDKINIFNKFHVEDDWICIE